MNQKPRPIGAMGDSATAFSLFDFEQMNFEDQNGV